MGIFDIFGTGDQKKAAQDQITGLTNGQAAATPLLQQGADALKTNFAAGLQPFLQNFATANQGQQTYADATGVNGQAGQDRATANFHTDPGYQFTVDQTIQNIDRNKAATGQLASGGTNADVARTVSGLADQQYGSYVSRLAPFIGASSSAAGGIGNLDAGLGTSLNANFGQQADLGNATNVNIGNAKAGADLAGLNASGNIINTLMNGAKLFAGGAGGATSAASGIGSAVSGAAGGIGSLLSSFAPFLLSDERAKEDIEAVGELYDGQPIYRYKYIGGDPTTHIGLIAQEVEELEPDAVREFGGLKAVDYGKATSLAAALGDFLEAA